LFRGYHDRKSADACPHEETHVDDGCCNPGADVPMPVYDKADFKELDKIMQEVNFTSMPTVLIITYLRTTCSVSEYLDHWKDAVQRAKAELESRQEDWERILRGLL
jgi:hypothetical protein